MGKWLIIFGLLVLTVGILIQVGVDFSWFGNLPGDLKIKTGASTIYIPITTCLLVSAAITLVGYLVRVLN